MKQVRNLAQRAIAIGISAAVLFGLAACGSDNDEPTGDKTTTSASPSEDPDDPESAEDEGKPEWAAEATTPGDKLTTIKAGDVTVDVYQVDVTEATEAGNFQDPDSDKPIIDEGDDIVYVNYVITNTGDPIDLGSSLVEVEPRYKNWKFVQGMDTIADSELDDEMDVNTSALEPSKNTDPPIYTFGTDEEISFGDNFKYQKNSAITFTVTYIPVDEDGELLHDDKVEAKGKTTIE